MLNASLALLFKVTVPISDFDVLVHKQEYYRGRHTSAKTGIVHMNVLGGTGMVQMDILIQEKEGTVGSSDFDKTFESCFASCNFELAKDI
jgi:putative ribosome biogenesis GTPase RsgA